MQQIILLQDVSGGAAPSEFVNETLYSPFGPLFVLIIRVLVYHGTLTNNLVIELHDTIALKAE